MYPQLECGRLFTEKKTHVPIGLGEYNNAQFGVGDQNKEKNLISTITKNIISTLTDHK